MSEELKPCPFCGGRAAIFTRENAHWPHCLNEEECGAEGPGASDIASAAAAWNRRASHPAPTVAPVANRLMAVCERLANTPMEMSLGDWGECSVVIREAASTISALEAERDKAMAWAKEQHAAADRYAASLATANARIAGMEKALRDLRDDIMKADPNVLTCTLWTHNVPGMTVVDRIDHAVTGGEDGD
jgi:Lar family restriction alleviation protein